MPSDIDLERLIQAWQAGTAEDRTFSRLVDVVAPRLRRFFHRRGCSADDCQDLTQETLVRVFKGLNHFRGDVPGLVWIYQIASNVVSNHYRHRSALKRRLDSLSPTFDQIADRHAASHLSSPTPLSQAMYAEQVAALRAGIASLPPQMRRCLMLRVYQERPYREIATLLGVSIDTVKTHLLHARQRLRATLEQAPTGRTGTEER